MRINNFLVALLIIVSLGSFKNFDSKDLFSHFTKEQLKAANTAEHYGKLSNDEKEVVQIANLFRMHPAKIADDYLTPYFKKNKKQVNNYTKSLLNDLKKAKPCAALLPEDICMKSALSHAEKMGKSGKIGHDGMSQRLKPHGFAGENCDYGHDKALDIIMSLMIDEGVPSLGHRKNILEPDYTHIGTSIKAHKKYKHNCVMDFVRIEAK
jgi:uncharacterized protein YkwD